MGVRLPHSSDAIPARLQEVPLPDVRPGDIFWWPGHLALYAGAGWTIEALDARDGVVMRRARLPRRAFRPPG
jgi:cell wall-associated NlpC family hydrolase